MFDSCFCCSLDVVKEAEWDRFLMSWWWVSIGVSSEEVVEADVGDVLLVEAWIHPASTSEGL